MYSVYMLLRVYIVCLCECMNICAYIIYFLCFYVNVCMCITMYALSGHMFLHACVGVCVYIHLRMGLYVCLCMYACICMYMSMHIL